MVLLSYTERKPGRAWYNTSIMSAFDALILGLVEGLTEYLPISSTAHLILTAEILGIAQSNFAKTFEIAIQSGAIAAVVALYWRKFLDPRIMKMVLAAFIPTGVIGFTFYQTVKTHLIGNVDVVLWALAIGGVLLIVFERWYREPEENVIPPEQEITYPKALWIGLAQSVAMIPGVSRSAATIVGGMLLGIRRATIVEFSFLLAVPTLAAATALDLLKNYKEFSGAEFGTLGIGFLASFATALFAIRFLLRYIKRHAFTAFGIYRMLLVAIFLLFVY